MPFAAALSEHPDPAAAIGEVVGTVVEQLGEGPDLAVLFVGPTHVDATAELADAVRSLLAPVTLLGATAGTVAGGAREVEGGPAVALWAARMATWPVPVRLTYGPAPGGQGGAITGFPPTGSLPEDAEALLVLADPFSFPVDRFLDGLRDQLGVDLPVVGGLASAGAGPGGNRLVLDGEVLDDGAVGVVLAGVDVATVVSQGCRPIGDPLIVTKGAGRLVEQLAGQPALARLEEVVRALPPEDLQLARRGLHVGRVIDESKAEFDRGDFLIRGVLGADPGAGAVAVGDEVQVGATVQFQVRDASSADEDLRSLLADREADGALLFTCNGRGTHLFRVPDHDAGVLDECLGGPPLAGMSCAGELGPVGGRSFLHGFTASVLLLRDQA